MIRRASIAVLGLGLLLALVGIYSRWPRVKIAERDLAMPGTTAVMDLMEFNDRSGFLIYGRGISADVKTSFPRLPETNAFWSVINTEVRQQTRKVAREFTEMVSWSDLWWSIRERSGANEWQMEASWSVELGTPDFVSLLSKYWEYAGGAHHNTGYAALNAVRSGSGFQLVALHEFFKPGSEWRATVATTIENQINAQKHERLGEEFSPDLESNVEPEELSDVEFTFTPGGLKFWFAPYEKGSFAEGSFTPLIPYEEFLSLLDTNGPAQWLPCFQNPR